MGLISEFKEFALKGNAVDLAVGVVIGAAFGKIVTSIVNDIIMPPIGLLIGGVDFSDIKIYLRHALNGPDPKDPTKIIQLHPDVTINVGAFINNIISFLIVAISIFMVIKVMNTLMRKKEAAPAPAAPPAPTKEEELLTDIRDILKSRAT
jgi:large conductance mechanosensitive channel